MKNEILPVFYIESETCSEGWIKALWKVWQEGKEMPQHYGNTVEEKMSREATVMINVKDPLKEPRIHIGDYSAYASIHKGGYVKELLNGTIDHKVDQGVLRYTYHRRLWHWGKKVPNQDEALQKKKLPLMHLDNENGINQFEYLITKAVEEPISRKLQMTVWEPHKDLIIPYAPCLQRIWIRLIPNEEHDEFRGLVLQAHFRSRDLYEAWGSNCYGLVELGKLLAERISKRLSMKITLTQYLDMNNSLHVYAIRYKDVEGVFKTMEKRGIKVGRI